MKAIRANKEFKFNPRIFARTFASSIAKIFRFVRKHPRVFGSISLSLTGALLSSVISLYATGELVASVASKVRGAVEKNLNENTENIEKNIKKNVDSIKEEIHSNIGDVKKDIHSNITGVKDEIKSNVDNVKQDIMESKNSGIAEFEKDVKGLAVRFSDVLAGGAVSIVGIVVIKKWVKKPK